MEGEGQEPRVQSQGGVGHSELTTKNTKHTKGSE